MNKPLQSSQMYKILLVLMFLLFFFLRIIDLNADPQSFHEIGIPTGDEGGWIDGPRRKALFDTWVMDDFNAIFILPTFSISIYSIFSLFGVGLSQARLLSVLFSFFSLILFYKTLKNGYNKKTAYIGVFFLGINYIYLMYSRFLMAEAFLIFFYVLTFYFWEKSLRDKRYFIAVGIALFLSLVAKPPITIMFFFTVVISLIVYKKWKTNKSETKHIFRYFIIGFSIALFLYLIIYFIPNYDYIKASSEPFLAGKFASKGFIAGKGLWETIVLTGYKIITFGSFNQFFVRMPIISLLFFIYIAYYVKRMFIKFKETNPLNFFVLNWILMAVAFMMLFNFPIRRMIPMIPPIVIFASQAVLNINKILKYRDKIKDKLFRAIYFTLIFYSSYIIISNVIKFLFKPLLIPLYSLLLSLLEIIQIPSKLIGGTTLNAKLVLIANVFSLIITPLVIWVYFKFFNIRKKRVTVNPKKFVTVILLLVFIINIAQFVSWYNNRTHMVVETSKELGTILPKYAKVHGFIAAIASIENTICPVYMLDIGINTKDKFNRTDVKYIITSINPRLGRESNATEDMLRYYKNAKLIKKWKYPEMYEDNGIYKPREIGLFDKFPNEPYNASINSCK